MAVTFTDDARTVLLGRTVLLSRRQEHDAWHEETQEINIALQNLTLASTKAYMVILLTQGSEAENSAGRQITAVTGSARNSGVSVGAFQEIEELPSIPRRPNDEVHLKVEEIKPSGEDAGGVE
jgi:hypothetical protein